MTEKRNSLKDQLRWLSKVESEQTDSRVRNEKKPAIFVRIQGTRAEPGAPRWLLDVTDSKVPTNVVFFQGLTINGGKPFDNPMEKAQTMHSLPLKRLESRYPFYSWRLLLYDCEYLWKYRFGILCGWISVEANQMFLYLLNCLISSPSP